ncbi:DoxX family protein [Sediminicola luteus]|uniref:DoxX family protein n=1 Tax=Sediminicola luteus TaxID=319238 RepID=A0A2A4GCK9_9FLAO|nr:DoxX family membrane protein [Sediminicola luteus]PCE66193.1 hypothetical protein B7P33_02530 [Sediminicola luteus]
MKPLAVLFASFALFALYALLFRPKLGLGELIRWALGCMFLFTALGHFIYPQGMSAMIPDMIPYRTTLVLLSGLLEIGFGLFLLSGYHKKIVGWAILVFLVLSLPLNIYAAQHQIDYTTGNTDGPGLTYLWFRIPLQLFFMVLIFYANIKTPKGVKLG